jgi:uncharacterized RDD family membrane protein YckC
MYFNKNETLVQYYIMDSEREDQSNEGKSRMRKLLDILTPENVYVEFELAGLGSRTVAALIDGLIQVGMMIVVAVVMLISGINFEELDWLGSTVIAAGIAILFVIWFGYHIFFEMVMNGQTPGKKVVKLRVVRETGEPVTFFESFLRNLLRVVDMLPSLYLVGAVFLIFTKQYKRIGDFAANTIVVKTTGEKKCANTLESLIQNYSQKNGGENGDAINRPVNIYPVNNLEYGVLKEFLMRRYELGSRLPVFVNCLTAYFLRKFRLANLPFGNPIRFLEEIAEMNSGM